MFKVIERNGIFTIYCKSLFGYCVLKNPSNNLIAGMAVCITSNKVLELFSKEDALEVIKRYSLSKISVETEVQVIVR